MYNLQEGKNFYATRSLKSHKWRQDVTDNIFRGKKRKKNNKIDAWQSFQYESVEKLRMFSKNFGIKDKNLNK